MKIKFFNESNTDKVSHVARTDKIFSVFNEQCENAAEHYSAAQRWQFCASVQMCNVQEIVHHQPG